MSAATALLQQDWTGELLFAVQGHHPAGDPARLAALSLQLGQRWLTLHLDPESEPQLRLAHGRWTPPEELEMVCQDLSKQDPFVRFLHCPLYSWWLMQGELGDWDGLMLAFARDQGLIVLNQPGGLEVLAVSASH